MQFENKEVNQYERKIISYLLRDRKYVKIALGHRMKPMWFSSEQLCELFKKIKTTYENYGLELNKRIFMDEIKRNEEVSIDEYTDYEKFYDWCYMNYDGEDNFNYYLSHFQNYGVTKEITHYIGQYEVKRKDVNPKECLDYLKRKINKISYEEEDEGIKLLDYISDYDEQIKDIVARRDDPGTYVGIPTGYYLLDECFTGFMRGTVSLVVGLTGTGKSTFISNMGVKQCFALKKNVLIFSLEDSALIWSHKMTAWETGISCSDILKGRLTNEQIDLIKKTKTNRTKDSFGGYKIFQMPPQKYSVTDIEDEIEEKIIGSDEIWYPDIIYIDQMSLVAPEINRGNRFDMQSGDITKSLARLAKKYNVPVVLNCQGGRSAVTKHKDGKVVDIQLENIQQSSQPSQDARFVLALETNDDDIEGVDEKHYSIKILKNSYGPTGREIPFIFRKSLLTFEEVSESEGDEGNFVTTGVIKPEIDDFMNMSERKSLEHIIDKDFDKIDRQENNISPLPTITQDEEDESQLPDLIDKFLNR